MAFVIESSIWEPDVRVHLLIFVSCLLSIFFFPYFSENITRSSVLFGPGISSSAIRFQKTFLLLYTLASACEGIFSVFGESEIMYFGASRDETVLYLSVVHLAAIVPGTLLGMLSDLIGHQKLCLVFWMLHIVVCLWKRIITHPVPWMAAVLMSFPASIFSFSFETWMIVEHEKLGHKQEYTSHMFWLMTFFESAASIGSQAAVNWLIGNNMENSVTYPPIAAIFLSLVGIFYTSRGWRSIPQSDVSMKDYTMSFRVRIFGDGKILLLICAQACLQFSLVYFWILWAPIMVADGREVNLGRIYPCFLGARMVGSTAFPWLTEGSEPLRTEEYLIYAFALAGLVFGVVGYDYQELGYLLLLFCIYNVCVGVILPSLAKLRSMYVPTDVRGGMMSLSIALSSVANLFFLWQGGFHKNIPNSTILAFAALALLLASGCMYLLKQSAKKAYTNSHNL